MITNIDSKSTVKIIRLKYIMALSIIVILVISSHLIMERTNNNAEFDSRIINIAGRQRMLSQKITKCVLGIYNSKTSAESNEYLDELKITLGIWVKSHKGLISGDGDLKIPGKNSETVTNLFEKLDINFSTIVNNTNEIIEIASKKSYSKELIYPKLQIIRENELIFLPIMDKIVFQYDSESKGRIDLNKKLNLLLGLFTLFILVLEALFIFKPLEKEVGDIVDNLIINEENLRKLFDVAPQTLFLVLPHTYEILRLNQQATETLGLNFDVALGKKITDFIDKKEIERIDVVDKNKFNGHIDNVEITLTNAMGEESYMLLSASRIFYHNQSIFLVGLTNISKQKKQEKELNYFATIDEMTGLINRRAGLMFLEKEFIAAKRGHLSLSLAFVDIDGLKVVNDTFGHEQGDKLIKGVASMILKNVREGDVALRYGGDEFIIILKYCSYGSAKIILDRIVLDLEILNKTSPFKFDISFGIVEYDEQKYSNETEFINSADVIMYENKLKKRNKSI